MRGTEYFAACPRSTDPWNKCPARMLRHKALMQCARVAFGFSGVQDEDDAYFANMPKANANMPTVRVIEGAKADDAKPDDELSDAGGKP